MNFLKVSEGVFVNTANILKFETTAAGSIVIYLVGERAPIEVVSNNPEAAGKWIEWLAPNTVNIVPDSKAK